VVAGRVVLPYWTDRHAGLALAVDNADKRVGLGGVSAEAVTVTRDRLRAPLPLYLPGDTDVLLRLTGPARHEIPGTLSPSRDGSGALLEAVLPVADLERGLWRIALSPAPPADAEPRFLTLPPALRVGGGGVQVVRPPGPSAVRRLSRGARRVLGRVRRKAASRVKAWRT
jgi:hypothetical protein